MAIADGLICQVYPVAGETSIKNIVDNTTFTGTGTPTLVDEGAEKAWSISTGTLLESNIPLITVNGENSNAGATIAMRFKSTSLGTDSFMPIAGARLAAAALSNGLLFGRGGSQIYRGRIDVTLTASMTSRADNTIHTLVYKVSTSATSNTDVGGAWVNTVGRVGTAANFVSTSANIITKTFDKAFINCQTNSAYQLLDLAIWGVEKSDADCAAIADDYRAVMPAPSGGTAPTGTVTIGAIVPSSTGASVPFTYYAADQTGFEYQLNETGTIYPISASPATPTGLTSSTAYTIRVRAKNASGSGAWSTAANFTTSAAGSPPAGTFTVGTITTTQTTASVPYTYSAADFDSIECRIDGGAAVTASASPQSLTGLTAGTTHGIEFRAVNAFGNGAWSASAPFTTASVPVGTIAITDVANNSDTPWTSTAVDAATIMPLSLGSVVVNKTGLSTTAGADLVITDAAITTGTEYIIILKIGTAYGWYRAVAT